ncbi:MAG: Bax inhibitor-1/YccA family protein [Clostridia bacterium]|nr:Bax inhibitor-1/YccA family protein [Clostridia bacterium]
MMGFEEENSPVMTNTTTNTNDLLGKVFFRMFLGLLATAIAAGYTYYSGALYDFVEGGGYTFCIIAELVVVLVFSFGFRKFSPGVVTALFFAYAILTGVTFSSIFILFELESIVYAFIGSATIFGILAYVGKNTNKDLTKFGTILSVTLLVGLIVSLINLFVGYGPLEIALDWIILAIFMGFTVYDMNKITNIQMEGYMDDEHLYVYGAMELYLDFINIFIRILYLFGNRRRD